MNRERYQGTWNDPGTVPSAESAQIIKNVKIIFQNLIKNYFDSRHTEFKKRDTQIIRFMTKEQFTTKVNEKTPIHIIREFPQDNRKYPFIMVSTEGFKEKKLYLGWDNIAFTKTRNVQGMTISEIDQVQQRIGTVSLGVAVQSGVDDRDMLVDYLSGGFISFFRSNYIFQHPDTMSVFIIHVGSEEIETEYDPTPVEDTAGGEIFPIYLGGVKIHVFAEHYYKVTSMNPKFNYQFNGTADPFSP